MFRARFYKHSFRNEVNTLRGYNLQGKACPAGLCATARQSYQTVQKYEPVAELNHFNHYGGGREAYGEGDVEMTGLSGT